MAYNYRVELELTRKLSEKEMKLIRDYFKSQGPTIKTCVVFADCEASDCGKCYDCVEKYTEENLV